MNPFHTTDTVTLHHGDCLDVIREIPDASVDAVVTDPPYGLGFMGKAWDDLPPGEEWARECLRVLKPGGHLLAFGGSRTWHRLAAAVEDAGFEIRDSIAWLYGSGFSKGGLLGNRSGVLWCECGGNPIPYDHAGDPDLPRVRQDVHSPPVPRGEGQDPVLLAPVQRPGARQGVGEARGQGPGGMVAGSRSVSRGEDARGAQPVVEGRQLHRAGEGLPHGAESGASEVEGERLRGRAPVSHGADDRPPSGAAGRGAPHQSGPGGQPAGESGPVSGSHVALDDGALRGRAECPRCGGLDPAFRGFSTTLKPAFEPIVVGRKPLAGTVAANVLAHGTGALNIDGSRVGTFGGGTQCSNRDEGGKCLGHGNAGRSTSGETFHGANSEGGRWPANVVLDDTQAAELDRQSGTTRSNVRKPTGRDDRGVPNGDGNVVMRRNDTQARGIADQGGASRFFPTFKYQAKAPTRERPKVDGTSHATVKPLELMRWLVRLVTPPGGVVLEPFAGSGATVEACILEGFQCIAIEREAEYLPLILHRVWRSS